MHVAGDVLGNLAVGDYNVLVTAERSVVQVFQRGDRPRPERRRDVRLLPRRTKVVLRGRDRELADIRAAVAEAESLLVQGADGVGKSALIRYAALRLSEERSGIVFVNGAGRAAADIAQQIFEACYDSTGYRPSAVELKTLMADVQVCVVIDDLECEPADLTDLLDAVPSAAFVITSSGSPAPADPRVLTLEGLTREDSRAVLADALHRPLRPAEEQAADALWEATRGNPLDLRRAAAAVGSGADGAAALPRPSEVAELLPRVLAGLSGPEAEVVSLLAAAGTGVSGEVLAYLLGRDDGLGGTGERLTELGLVTGTELGYRLAAGVPEALRGDLVPTRARLAGLADRLTEWIAVADPAPQAIADHSQLLAAVTEAATLEGRPDDGARLAAKAAPRAACSLALEPWRRILARGRAAAQSAGDRKLLAYFTNESGVCSLLSGQYVAAASLMGVAALLWTKAGEEGAAVAAQQTQVLCGPGASVSPAGGPAGSIPDLGSTPFTGTSGSPAGVAGGGAKAGAAAKAAAVTKVMANVVVAGGVVVGGGVVIDTLVTRNSAKSGIEVGPLKVSPAGLRFSTVVGGGIPAARLTLTNTSDETVVGEPVRITGSGFRLRGDGAGNGNGNGDGDGDGGCAGRRLRHAESCTVTVAFTPDKGGSFSGAVRIRVKKAVRDVPLRGVAAVAPLAGGYAFTGRVQARDCDIEGGSGYCATVRQAAAALLAQRAALPIQVDPLCVSLPCSYVVAGPGWGKSTIRAGDDGAHELDPADLSAAFQGLARRFDGAAEVTVTRVALSPKGRGAGTVGGLRVVIELHGRILGRKGSATLDCDYAGRAPAPSPTGGPAPAGAPRPAPTGA